MALAARRERVLILGGGDGLAARDVLRWPGVESVTLVDLDPAVTTLARTHAALRVANQGSLDDPRVRIVHQDAGAFVAEPGDPFDVIARRPARPEPREPGQAVQPLVLRPGPPPAGHRGDGRRPGHLADVRPRGVLERRRDRRGRGAPARAVPPLHPELRRLGLLRGLDARRPPRPLRARLGSAPGDVARRVPCRPPLRRRRGPGARRGEHARRPGRAPVLRAGVGAMAVRRTRGRESGVRGPAARVAPPVSQALAAGGHHLLADFWVDDAEPLRRVAAWETRLPDACRAAGATVLGARFHQFEPEGVTGVVLLAESHASLHTWPEAGLVTLDVFTCGAARRGGHRRRRPPVAPAHPGARDGRRTGRPRATGRRAARLPVCPLVAARPRGPVRRPGPPRPRGGRSRRHTTAASRIEPLSNPTASWDSWTASAANSSTSSSGPTPRATRSRGGSLGTRTRSSPAPSWSSARARRPCSSTRAAWPTCSSRAPTRSTRPTSRSCRRWRAGSTASRARSRPRSTSSTPGGSWTRSGGRRTRSCSATPSSGRRGCGRSGRTPSA